MNRRRGRAGRPPLAALAILALTACATTPSSGPPPRRATPAADAEPPRDLLADVRADYEAADFLTAARTADSLYFEWRGDGDRAAYADSALWLEAAALQAAGRRERAAGRLIELIDREPDDLQPAAVRTLAALLASLAREPEAAAILLANPDAAGDGSGERLRAAARRMSIEELSRVSGSARPANAFESVVAAEYARALAEAGRDQDARRIARAVASTEADSTDLALAAAVLAGDVARAEGPVRIGAILPLTGRFATVGRFMENGMRLALRGGGETASGIELVVRDDGSDPERTPALVRELEDAGVVGVLGPIRSQAFAAAAEARSYAGLLLVSPTATEMVLAAPNAYTLWDRAQRASDVASEIGRWLASEFGIDRVGALVTETPVGREALLAFRAGALSAGATLSAYAAYSTDSTTFARPIELVASFAPQAVFVSADDPSTVLQIGPQLSFYGLRDIILVGGPSWAEPATVRRLDPSFANHRLVGTFVDQFGDDGAWAQFKRSYEVTFRVSLRDNMLPALGHDAMVMVLAALADQPLARPGAVARAFGRLERIRGASGQLRPRPESSTVSRTPLIRMILDRRLVEVEPAAVEEWLAEVDAIEAARSRRKQLDAEEAVTQADEENGTP